MMTAKNLLLIALAGFGVFPSCAKRALSPPEYISWIDDPENRLTDNKKIDDFEFELQYKPADYLALRELKNQEPTAEQIKEKRKAYENIHYFVFKISTAERDQDVLKAISADAVDYQQYLSYFISGIKNDFYLIEGGDTLSCSFHSHERTYNLEPYSTFLIAFDKSRKEKTTDLTFLYDDKVLGCGPVQVKIDKSTLESIPAIKTEL